jgi:ATP-binding cassette subfamily F protein 3
MTDAQERLKILGGHSIEAEIEKIMVGLGFDRNDLLRLVTELSGGWQMRVELAKILLSKPDCILLDEPTNHLDIESVQWLENYLNSYYGAVVIVSHDRQFLDNVTNRTIEITMGKTFDMPLPYTRFIEARQELYEQQLSSYRNQQKQIAETEKFIERFRYKATLASRVQSRIKQLDKVDRIELDEEDVSQMHFRFPVPLRSGRLVAEVFNLKKSFDDKHVFTGIDFAIERNDKIAFVGKNGEGKSTLTRILAGMESYEGKMTIGTNVTTGFFSQHSAQMIDENSTPFEIIDNAATGEMRTQVRSLLGAFLFSGDSVYKKVKVLSGGEKSRLALALLLLQPANFLILDEPTNHLDMTSKDVLKQALKDYTGTLIVVSHDREFLHGLTNRTVYFGGGKIKEYTGDISEFLEKQNLERLNELEYSASKNNSVSDTNNVSTLKTARLEQKAVQREQNRIKRLITQSETEIEKLETQISSLEADFADSSLYSDVAALKDKQILYDQLRQALSTKMNEWEDLHEQLEAVV